MYICRHLAREVKRKAQLSRETLVSRPDMERPRVFVSSVCDAYQLAEKRYGLSPVS